MSIAYRSVGALVKAVRLARKSPLAWFSVPGDFPIRGQDVLDNFAKGVMRRCNRGLQVGSDKRLADLHHDARIINDAKNRIRWSGRNLLRDLRMQRRYPELHNRPFDED